MNHALAANCRSYLPISALLAICAVPFGKSAFKAVQAGASKEEVSEPPLADTAPAGEANAFQGSVLLLVAAAVGAETSVATWAFSDGLLRISMTQHGAAFASMAFWSGLVGGRILGATLASPAGGKTAYSPGQLLRGLLPLALAGSLGALLLPFVTSGPMQAATYCISLGVVGAGLSVAFPSAVALLSSLVPPTSRTQSAVQIAACLGAGVAAPLSGVLAASAGSGACFGIAAACAAIGLASLYVALSLAQGLEAERRTRRR